MPWSIDCHSQLPVVGAQGIEGDMGCCLAAMGISAEQYLRRPGGLGGLEGHRQQGNSIQGTACATGRLGLGGVLGDHKQCRSCVRHQDGEYCLWAMTTSVGTSYRMQRRRPVRSRGLSRVSLARSAQPGQTRTIPAMDGQDIFGTSTRLPPALFRPILGALPALEALLGPRRAGLPDQSL